LKNTCAKNTTATSRQKNTHKCLAAVRATGGGSGQRRLGRRRLGGGSSAAARRQLGGGSDGGGVGGGESGSGGSSGAGSSGAGNNLGSGGTRQREPSSAGSGVGSSCGGISDNIRHPVEEHEEEVGLMVPGTGGSLHPDVAAAASRLTRHTCGPQVP